MINLPIKIYIFFAVLSLSEKTLSLEVSALRDGYILQIESVDLPKNILNKKFKSGLETDIVYFVDLISESQKINVASGQVKVRYDLWDEVYQMNLNKELFKSYKSLSDVYAALENLTVRVKQSQITKFKTQKFKVRTSFLLNPIGKEKSKKIKEWIAEHNVGISTGSSRAGTAGRGVQSVFSGIVNRMVMGDLDRKIYGSDKKFEFISPEYDLRKVAPWIKK